MQFHSVPPQFVDKGYLLLLACWTLAELWVIFIKAENKLRRLRLILQLQFINT